MNDELAIRLSPLEIEGYYVREFRFAVRPDIEENMRLAMQGGLHVQSENLFNPDEITFNLQSGGGFHAEDPSRMMAIVELETKNPPERKVPYDFRVVLVGYFKLHGSQTTDMENVEKAIKINMTSILYSAARELIAVVTGRGPFPAMILPSIVISLNEQKAPAAIETQARSRHEKTAKKATKKRVGKKKSG